MNPAGTGASFNKRIVWTQLIAFPILYAAAIITIMGDPTNALRTALILAGYLVFALMVFIVVAAAAALATKQEPNDERDESAHKTSYYHSTWSLYTGCVLATVLILGQQIARGFIQDPSHALLDSFFFTPLFPAHILVLSMVVAEVVSLSYRAMIYRS